MPVLSCLMQTLQETEIRVPSGVSFPIKGKDVVVDFQPKVCVAELRVFFMVNIHCNTVNSPIQHLKVGLKGHTAIIDGTLFNKVNIVVCGVSYDDGVCLHMCTCVCVFVCVRLCVCTC